MKRIIIILIAAVVAGGLIFFFIQKREAEPVFQEASPRALIGEYDLRLAIAKTPREQAQGLAGRESIADDFGMLFVFPDYQYRTFWMKGMLVPIDIIWIRDGLVVGYEDEVPPPAGAASKNLTLYRSPEAVNYVLEVRAGTRKEQGWKVGEKAVFFGLD